MTDMNPALDRILTLELARVTERAAVAATIMRGKGNEKAADQLAVDAMRRELNELDVDGTVVIGEGERDKAPMLYIGEKVGTKNGPKVDIALDPLEGTTLCAKAKPNSLAVLAMAVGGTLLHAPDVYMDKIAIGGQYDDGIIDLDFSPTKNLENLAKAKNCKISDLGVCILDRERHAELIAEVRETGASIMLIEDGDIAGVIATVDPDKTGVDIYMGIGGAPEGVLAAAALRCIGGFMQTRLVTDSASQKQRATEMGVTEFDKKLNIRDMASGDVIFSATGVTDGDMLFGVRHKGNKIETETLVMRSSTGTVRRIIGEHYKLDKFSVD
ncbi:MAG: class II fructose-bisphosphatase [Rhizobiales bacterium]|nr:class II fructose-bisphosphatase [Hyphomicrobiales bacterium]NRB15000.1 class II fructose-bisphosphatase [Hyphomicrobiales bacterium]